MIAYHAADVPVERAAGHPRFARLKQAGPWSYKPHASGGTLAFWPSPDGAIPKQGAFCEARACADGLNYLGPIQLPTPSQLARDVAGRPDCTKLLLTCGVTIAILPAYLEPRKVLSTGELGDPVTVYGKLSRSVRDRLGDKAEGSVSLLDPELLALCRSAMMTCYRITDELIDDLGWLTTADIDPIISATFHYPQDVQKKTEAAGAA